jgi:hypothetical protein
MLDKVISDLMAKTNVASFLFMDKGLTLFLINSLMLLTLSLELESIENIQKIKQKKNFILFISKVRIYTVYLIKVIFNHINFGECKKSPLQNLSGLSKHLKHLKL